MKQQKVQTLPIEQLVLDPACQARAEIHQDAVDDYAQVLRDGGELPPVEVFLVVGQPIVVNGFHRVGAHVRAGVSFVPTVTVGTGTLDEAAYFATAANAKNGIRRSAADKRHAVRLALLNPIGAEQSSRVIAEHVGVSDHLVTAVRTELEANRPANCENAQLATTRKGKDGKQRPARQLRDLAVQPATPRADRPAALEASNDSIAHESQVEVRAGQESHVEVDDGPESRLPPWRSTLLALARDVAALRLRAVAAVKDTTVHRQSLERSLRDAEGVIDSAIPEVCPHCGGPGCARCQSRGWVVRTDASQAKATAKALGRKTA